jgi:DNA polymerase III alpha subunit
MAFVTLEDDTGTLESVWFPHVYRACGPLIESGCPFWVQGKGSLDHGVISLEVVKAWLP